MASEVWTDDVVKLLPGLIARKLSAVEIAEELFRATRVRMSRNAVIGKLRRLGLDLKSPLAVPRAANTRATPARRIASSPVAAATAPLAPEIIVEPALKPAGEDVATVTLLELQPHHCRWPIGDPLAPGFGFCGAQKIEGKPYCAGHTRCAEVRT